MKEIWKDIKGWEALYQVSNLGRVRSLDRVVLRPRDRKATIFRGRVLRAGKLLKGYLGVVLSGEGRLKTCTIHRLVAKAFVPNPKNLPLVRHLDSVRTNAKSSNLAWGTMRDNARDRRCSHCGNYLHRKKKA